MKKFLLGLMAATFLASNASAALLDLTDIVFSSQGQDLTNFGNGSTAITFLNLNFNVTTCAGAQAGLCGATATLDSSPLNSADVGRQITFAGGLVYTIDPGWSVSGTQLFTTGTFSAASFDDTPGQIQFGFADVNGDLLGSFTANGTTAPVPEPASLVFMGSGLVALGLLARRRAKR